MTQLIVSVSVNREKTPKCQCHGMYLVYIDISNIVGASVLKVLETRFSVNLPAKCS